MPARSDEGYERSRLQFRILTYNVHGCVGVDRRHDPERIARVIDACRVDVAALQELDAHGRFGIDQPRWLAERLEMSCLFVAARPSAEGSYGNALLSRLPLELVHNGPLPCWPGYEQRAAQWARLSLDGTKIDIVNTHLGLGRKERWNQVECLAGLEWLGSEQAGEHSVLCGDLNALPPSRVVRFLLRRFRDAAHADPSATFPSLWPLFRLDYVLTSGALAVRDVSVAKTRLARIASDHLPLIVELGLPSTVRPEASPAPVFSGA
jgi:endonuclease/exonuclease/phosphatase family metal-dependent hydrolase